MTEGSREEVTNSRSGQRRRTDRPRDKIAPLRPPSKSRKSTLCDAEKYDRTLFETMAEGFALHEILCDAEGRPCDYRFLEVNPAFERQTGLKAADLVGRTVREVVPDVEPMWIERFGRVALTGKPEHFEAPSEALGRYFEVRAYQTDPGRFATVFSDVTDRKRVENAARDVALFPEQNPFPVLRIAFDGTLLYANSGATALLKTWKCRVGRAVPSKAHGAIEQTLATGNPGEIEIKCGSVLYSFAIVPIRAQGYANLYGHDVTERKATEEALRESESRLRLAQVSAGVGIWDWDISTGKLEWSEELFHLFGLDPGKADASLDSWTSVLHRDDRHAAQQRIAEAINNRTPLDSEYRIVLPSGQVRWINALGNTTYDRGGKPERMTGICIDITERKGAEEDLQESREDLDRAQTVGQIGSWRMDIQRNVLTWSDENHRIFGAPKGAPMTYETFLATVHPDDRQYVDMRWQAGLGGEPYDIEHRIVVEGQVKWLREKAYLECDDEGKLLGGFGITQDITERKRTEQALRQSEQRLRMALEGGCMGLWEWDVQNDGSFWDERVYELISADPQTAPGAAAFFERVHPADRERLQAQMRDVLTTSGDFQAEFRVVRPDEKIVWLASRSKVIRDEQNRGVRMLGVLYDVTQRKEMEAELHRLNDQLEEEVRVQTEELGNTVNQLQEEVARRRLAEKNLCERSRLLEGFFRHTITPLAFMDRQFNFVQVNDAYARVDGKEPDDFMGKNHFALYPHAENQAIFEEVVRTKQPYHALAKPFAYPQHPERGVSYWNWQLTPLLDDAGEVQFLVLNLQDVTARQEAMQELEKRTSQLQRLTAELSEAEDRERRRLAELLHDDLQQLLVGSKLRLNILAKKTKGTPEVREIIEETTGLIGESIHKSRGLSHELSPPVLHHGDLREVLQWLIEQIHTTCGLKVRLKIGAAVDLPSQTLKTFIYKAAREMLFNVVKHANVKRAAIVVQQRDQSIYLTVLDKGRGFEPELLDVAGQNGFGLFNIRERVQFLGGSLTVQSVPDRGSRFILTIPLSVPGETAVQRTGVPILSTSFRPATQQAKDTPVAKHRFRILLVDDHKVMRDGLAALLEEEPDIEVVGQAGDGRDAITLTAQLKPDVVVMDVVMPIIDGEEATRQIRARWPHVRVVALSMLEEDTTRERMLKAGAEVFLSKAGPSEVIAAAIRHSS